VRLFGTLIVRMLYQDSTLFTASHLPLPSSEFTTFACDLNWGPEALDQILYWPEEWMSEIFTTGADPVTLK